MRNPTHGPGLLLGCFLLLWFSLVPACETATEGEAAEGEGEGDEGEGEGDEGEGEGDEGEGEGDEGEGEADEGEGEADEGEGEGADEGEGEGAGACHDGPRYAEGALRADLNYLASAELAGRVPGSPGGAAAIEMITARFACLGLSRMAGLTDYTQPFSNGEGQSTANVLGLLPGRDPAVAAETILINAHHDHLGRGKLGANDNASGVAALLAIAAALTQAPDQPRRSVLFAAFGSEEPGWEGSEHFAAHPPAGFDLGSVVYELNLDMVGSYDATGAVYLLGSFPATAGRTLADEVLPRYPELNVLLGEGSAEADNVPFCTRGIPYLFAWTEDPDCYHATCDTVDRIDYPHLATIAELMGELTTGLAETAVDLARGVRPGENVCGADEE